MSRDNCGCIHTCFWSSSTTRERTRSCYNYESMKGHTSKQLDHKNLRLVFMCLQLAANNDLVLEAIRLQDQTVCITNFLPEISIRDLVCCIDLSVQLVTMYRLSYLTKDTVPLIGSVSVFQCVTVQGRWRNVSGGHTEPRNEPAITQLRGGRPIHQAQMSGVLEMDDYRWWSCLIFTRWQAQNCEYTIQV